MSGVARGKGERVLAHLGSQRGQSVAFVVAASTLAVVSGVLVQMERQRLSQTSDEAGQLRARTALAESVAAPSLPSDFVSRLHSHAGPDAAASLVAATNRVATALGVSFTALSSSGREPTVQTLGRTELSLTLRGSYANVKRVLTETLDQHPSAVVQQLTMKRLSPSADVEAQVRLTLLSGPVQP